MITGKYSIEEQDSFVWSYVVVSRNNVQQDKTLFVDLGSKQLNRAFKEPLASIGDDGSFLLVYDPNSIVMMYKLYDSGADDGFMVFPVTQEFDSDNVSESLIYIEYPVVFEAVVLTELFTGGARVRYVIGDDVWDVDFYTWPEDGENDNDY